MEHSLTQCLVTREPCKVLNTELKDVLHMNGANKQPEKPTVTTDYF